MVFVYVKFIIHHLLCLFLVLPLRIVLTLFIKSSMGDFIVVVIIDVFSRMAFVEIASTYNEILYLVHFFEIAERQ